MTFLLLAMGGFVCAGAWTQNALQRNLCVAAIVVALSGVIWLTSWI